MGIKSRGLWAVSAGFSQEEFDKVFRKENRKRKIETKKKLKRARKRGA